MIVRVSTPTCHFCHKGGTVDVPVEGVDAYLRGALVQDAFPDLPAPLREQIKSGDHPECWDAMLGVAS